MPGSGLKIIFLLEGGIFFLKILFIQGILLCLELVKKFVVVVVGGVETNYNVKL